MYCYVLTISYLNPQGILTNRSGQGKVEAAGLSRLDVCTRLLRAMCAEAGVTPAETAVMFFSLEPDEL